VAFSGLSRAQSKNATKALCIGALEDGALFFVREVAEKRQDEDEYYYRTARLHKISQPKKLCIYNLDWFSSKEPLFYRFRFKDGYFWGIGSRVNRLQVPFVRAPIALLRSEEKKACDLRGGHKSMI
jgi:hypothetical protein